MADKDRSLHPYEQRDVDGRGLVVFAVAFAGFMVISTLILLAVFQAGTPDFGAAEPQTASDFTETHPRKSRLEFERQEAVILNSYAWNDESHRSARVPIAVAIDMVGRNGLPDWTKGGGLQRAIPRLSGGRTGSGEDVQ